MEGSCFCSLILGSRYRKEMARKGSNSALYKGPSRRGPKQERHPRDAWQFPTLGTQVLRNGEHLGSADRTKWRCRHLGTMQVAVIRTEYFVCVYIYYLALGVRLFVSLPMYLGRSGPRPELSSRHRHSSHNLV
jgi:hypothetical protein